MDAAESMGTCCGPAHHERSTAELENDVRTFAALANETRYEALRLLSASQDEICACNLVPALGVNQSTTSRALGELYRAGLVDRRKDGRWRYYRATPRAETILAAIDETRED